MSRRVVFKYLTRCIVWYIGNVGFGIIPIIFLGIVYVVSDHKLGSEDADKLIHEGAFLFVCCAIMGSVLLDFLQSGLKVNSKAIFVTCLAPVIVIGFLCLKYLFVTLKIIDPSCFDILSSTSLFIMIFSFGYSVTNKANLLIIEKLNV